LPEIIEQKSRENDGQPGKPDGAPAEMPEVGIQGLAAGDDENHRSQHHHAVQAVDHKESYGVAGVQGHQNFGFLKNL
jgi:hypothetical protein